MRALSDSADAKEITALVKHVSNELKVQVWRPVAILWKVSNLSKLLPLDDAGTFFQANKRLRAEVPIQCVKCAKIGPIIHRAPWESVLENNAWTVIQSSLIVGK